MQVIVPSRTVPVVPGHDVIWVDTNDLELNISRWWNIGLAVATDRFVAVVNDDVLVPSGSLEMMCRALVESDTAQVAYCTERGMSGWCFVLDTKTGFRFDEQFRWYYGDTDMDCRLQSVNVATAVVHLSPGGRMTPEMELIAQEDARRFERKWLADA